MAADNIITKIERDASEEAALIIAEGERRAREAAEKIEREGREKIERIEAAAAEECSEAARRAELLGNLESRKAELASKRAVLDDAFSLALKTMCVLDDARWEKLITKVVLASVETGDEKLRVNEKDRLRYAGGALLGVADNIAKMAKKGEGIVPPGFNMLTKLNDAIKQKKGINARLTLDEKAADIVGGAIIVSKTSEVDCSFEALVRDMRRSCEKEVTDLLFGAEV